jgi:hypothetical protein
MANTLYDLLEVIPTASAETIHAAYRSLILRYHPDRVAAMGPELQVVANARTKEINFAYDILSDAISRARYDEDLLGEEHMLLPEDEDLRGEERTPLPVRGPPPPPQRPVVAAARAEPVRPKVAAARERVAAARAMAQDRHPLATLAAAVVGVALILTLPPAANLIFAAVEFSLTGHARFFYEAENPVDAKGDFGSAAYLPVLWGWLFANYLFGLISYRLAVLAGETAAERLGGSFAATNDRLFLFLTFVCVVAVGELFFSAHTMGNMVAGMFLLAGAYLAERGIT